jgi:AAA+ superfamily predicted ATPase
MENEPLPQFGESDQGHRMRAPLNMTRPGGYAQSAPMPEHDPRSAGAWARRNDMFYGVPDTAATIPAGVYRPGFHPQYGLCLNTISLETDALVALPDSVTADVVAEIKEFRRLGDRFRALGFLHKRGALLWGPPGGGKTVAVTQAIDIIVGEEGGVACLLEEPEAASAGLQLIRRIEPARPILAILEDLDALTERFGEAAYLAMLDGESQVDNIVFIATTNYPERLSSRFSNRPSRFDTVRYVGMPTAAARRLYLSAKLPQLNGQAEALVEASEGFSIAHLRELVVLTQCFGYDLESSAARLKRMKTTKPNSERSPEGLTAGFSEMVALS